MATQTQSISIACDDRTELQQRLNCLYEYQNDILTKVYHRSRLVLFQRMVRELIGDGVIRGFESALDIGCNAGFYSRLISDFGFRNVLGIDISAKYVAKANQEFGTDQPDKRIAFEVMNAADLLGAKKKYDFILCTEVIEHTGNREAVIASIMELLTPGGIAVISLPNCVSLGFLTTYAGSVLRGREMSQDLRDHLSFPFYKGPALFKEKGARIVRTAGVNCLFNSPLTLLLHDTPLFDPLNSLNFWLSARAPLKWLSQFFFFVITRDTSQATRG